MQPARTTRCGGNAANPLNLQAHHIGRAPGPQISDDPILY